jgi:hypothetical protein
MVGVIKRNLYTVVWGVAAALALVILGLYFGYNQVIGPCKKYEGLSELHCMNEFRGMMLKDAEERAQKAGLYPQVSVIDGRSQVTTQPRGMFVYFEVRNGVVVGGGFNEGLW